MQMETDDGPAFRLPEDPVLHEPPQTQTGPTPNPPPLPPHGGLKRSEMVSVKGGGGLCVHLKQFQTCFDSGANDM